MSSTQALSPKCYISIGDAEEILDKKDSLLKMEPSRRMKQKDVIYARRLR